MYFSSNDSQYTNRFLGHFLKFIQKYNLFGPTDNLLITVSGGVDSIALCWGIKLLSSYGYSNELRVLHINHGTRSGQEKEQTFVEDFCSHIGISCQTIKLEGLDPKENFEYKARLKRYESFYEYALANEKIVLAHHIDDSFEWSMLQSLRSSSIEGLIGVPLINGRVIRPFMCVTKHQILNFTNAFELPYIEDPSNHEIRYERNFIRHNVIPVFEGRYKKYLKHYVFRHNEIARRLGLHLLDKNNSSFSLVLGDESALIFCRENKSDYSGLEKLVLEGLKYLNPNSRGSVSTQLSKIVQAMSNNKTGPITFTKGVNAYLDYNLILLGKLSPKKLKFIWKTPKTFNYDEFGNFLSEVLGNPSSQVSFPFMVTVYNGNLDKRNFKTSFNIDCIKILQGMKLTYYPALKLKREWSKKRNRHKVLRINLFM